MSLSTRGISGKKCLDCCEIQREMTELSIRGLLSELLNQLLEIRSKGEEDQILAFVPRIKPIFFPPAPKIPIPRIGRIVRFTRGARLPIGAVVILATFALGSLVTQLAALETLQGVLDALEFYLPDTCERCISRKLWSQAKVQILVTERARVRVG